MDLVEDIASTSFVLDKYARHPRTRNEETWKRNITKRLRQSGKPYIGHNGVERTGRMVRQACGNCSYKCKENISEEQRQAIHASFWQLDDEKKKTFYDTHLKCVKPATSTTTQVIKKRTRTIQYFLPVDKEEIHVRVCSTFFCNTLDISSKRIRIFFDNKGGVEENPARKGSRSEKD